MVAKYLIAGAISAALAGGAVWVAADAAEMSHPHETVEKRSKANDKDNSDTAPSSARSYSSATKDSEPEAADSTAMESINDLLDRAAKRAEDEPSGAMKDGKPEAKTTVVDRPSFTSKPRDTKTLKAKPKGAMTVEAKDDDKASAADKAWQRELAKAKMIEHMGAHASHDHDAKDGKASMSAKTDKGAAPARKAWLDDYLMRGEEADDASATTRKMMSDTRRDAEEPIRTTRERIDMRVRANSKAEDDKSDKGDRRRATSRFTTRDLSTAPSPTQIKRITKAKPRQSTMRQGTGEGYFEMLVGEAEKIDITGVREDAYINIIDFALTEGEDDVAERLVGEISNIELRDVARRRIGVAYAKRGRMDAAFALIEEIEEEELRDLVRLEFIRAATALER